jgi:hypothetical protein
VVWQMSEVCSHASPILCWVNHHCLFMTFLTMEMDILGPFLKASRRTQLVLLVVEYFTKWVEVEALVKIIISKIIFFFFYGRTSYIDLDFHACLLLTTTCSLIIERWNNSVKGLIFSIGSPPSLILGKMGKLNSLIKYC